MAADGISSLEPVAGLFLRPDAFGSGNPASKRLFVEGAHHSLCSATAEPYGTQRPLRMVYDELRARMVQRRQTAVLSTLKRHVLGVLTGVNERTV